MIGETVGNYRVIELLGEGGMGVVYLAEHPGIGRRAAIKILRPGLTDNAEITKRFFNEARAADAIHHPGIVEVYDCGTLASDTAYIVMELLEGENLAARLRQVGRLPLQPEPHKHRDGGKHPSGHTPAAHVPTSKPPSRYEPVPL